jgi:hypothetical protein
MLQHMSRRNIRLGLGLIVVGALAAPGAHAQVYKCVGAGGKTVYSQSPCPSGVKSRVISEETRSSSANAPETKAAARSPAEQEMEYRKRQQERGKAEKKASDQAADEKRKADNCRRARETVAQYDIGGRISRVNANGERYFMDENQIAQERAKAQQEVDQSCK